MAIDSILRDIEPDYIKIALLTNAPNLNNELELDIEPKRPKSNLGNGKEKSKKQIQKLATSEEINELRERGIVTRGPKSKAQGYVEERLSFEQFLKDRTECLKIAPFVWDPKNWFPTLPEEHKSIQEQLRPTNLKKEEESRIAYEKRLAKECSPLDMEWDF